ncbi:MAG: MFS transporter [Actinomycetes bacterium]
MTSAARRARFAVVMLFVLNGAWGGNVVPRLPAIKDQLALSNTELGIAIAAVPVGALVAGALAGVIIHRLGSATTAVVSMGTIGVLLVGFGLAPSWEVLITVYFLAGALDSVCDVAMNAHGLRVQRLYRRSIINGFHAWWSVGAVVGGLLGSAAEALAIAIWLHLLTAGLMLAVASLGIWRLLLPGHDATERTDAHHGGSLRPVAGLLVALGAITLMAAVVEDSPASWGALFMINEVGAGAGVAGLAFVSCQAMQTVGRFVADRAVQRFGDVAVARLGGALACVASALMLALPSVPMTIVGFGLAGLGIATIFPGTYHAAGNLPGIASGTGVAVVSFIARVGFLVSPPVVGLVSDLLGLRQALVIVPVAALLIFVLAGALRPWISPGG